MAEQKNAQNVDVNQLLKVRSARETAGSSGTWKRSVSDYQI